MTAGRGKRTLRNLSLALVLLAAAGCTRLGLNSASVDIAREPAASPAALAGFGGDRPVETAEDWRDRRAPLLRQAFERDVYGPVPTELKARAISRRVVDPAYAGGRGVLEEIDVHIGEADDGPGFRMALALPAGAGQGERAPVILSQNFCGNPGNMGSELLSAPRASGACDSNGFTARIARLIFGAHIIESPTAQILERGYAYAAVFPSEIVADGGGPEQAARDLAAFASLLPETRRPTGAVAVWAAGFGWMLDVLEADPRLDPSRMAAYGHSRHGKAALLAGAFDPRIDAVLAHQSGKGGGTLTRAYAGETVKQITASYPHWFAPAYAAWADNEANAPVDQHLLIALTAPRPVLLGNGWKDVWSDPNGSFRAAVGADPVYRLLGVQGLVQPGMRAGPQDGAIEFYIRPGGHSVRKTDWNYFLDYLDRVLTGPSLEPASGGDARISR